MQNLCPRQHQSTECQLPCPLAGRNGVYALVPALVDFQEHVDAAPSRRRLSTETSRHRYKALTSGALRRADGPNVSQTFVAFVEHGGQAINQRGHIEDEVAVE
jgi:hypothetical protein